MFELLPLSLVFGMMTGYYGSLTSEDIFSILFGILFGVIIRFIFRRRSKIAQYFLIFFPPLLIILHATSVLGTQIVHNGAGIFIGFILTTIFLDKIKDQ